jgi:hypothetical protein
MSSPCPFCVSPKLTCHLKLLLDQNLIVIYYKSNDSFKNYINFGRTQGRHGMTCSIIAAIEHSNINHRSLPAFCLRVISSFSCSCFSQNFLHLSFPVLSSNASISSREINDIKNVAFYFSSAKSNMSPILSWLS